MPKCIVIWESTVRVQVNAHKKFNTFLAIINNLLKDKRLLHKISTNQADCCSLTFTLTLIPIT